MYNFMTILGAWSSGHRSISYQTTANDVALTPRISGVQSSSRPPFLFQISRNLFVKTSI